MFKSWLDAWKNRKKGFGKSSGGFFRPELFPLENRITPASVVISYQPSTGILTVNSNTNSGETNFFETTQDTSNPTTLNFNALDSGTTITTFPGSNVILGGTATSATLDTNNLANFTKIIFTGGFGDDKFVLNNLNGNDLASVNIADFSIETDVHTSGNGSGADFLTIQGSVATKGDGFFSTDTRPSSTLVPATSNKTFDQIDLLSTSTISSTGSGVIRLVADGLNSSNIIFHKDPVNSNNANISGGSGAVSLKTGVNGATFLNGNAINSDGGPINFETAVVLESSTSLATGNGNGSQSSTAILFSGNVNGVSASNQQLLLLTDGQVTFKGDAGTTTVPLGSMVIGSQVIQPSVLNFVGNVFASSMAANVQSFSSDKSITLSGSSGLVINSSGSVSIGSSNGGTVLTTTNRGDVSITNQGSLAINGNFNLDGSFTQLGTGSVTLGNISQPATLLNFNTNSRPITFSSEVKLVQDSQINANALGLVGLGGSITFKSNVVGSRNVQLTAGVGDISFQGSVGINSLENSDPVLAILVTTTNRVNVSGNVVADSFTINSATGTVNFNGLQSYSQFAGLSITTANSNAIVTINKAVTSSNNGQIFINNAGTVEIYGNLTTNSNSITLGGGGTGKIILAANLSSQSGTINIQNPVDFLGNISVQANGGAVSFGQAVNSYVNQTSNLALTGFDFSTFTFNGPVGGANPLGNLVIQSSKGVAINSSLNAGNLTVVDSSDNSVVSIKGNLLLTGNLLTQNTAVGKYSLMLVGANNQVNGTTELNHQLDTVLGNLNTSTFLFSGDFSQILGNSLTAQGSIIAGKGFTVASKFVVGGNNVGQVTLDLSSSSLLNDQIDVQPNERIIKNGNGELRFITNTSRLYQGSLNINAGSVVVLDDFSSILTTSISGGTLSGNGILGPVSGFSGTVSPGDPSGSITLGNTSMNNLFTLGLGLGGSGGNDSLVINGSLAINNASLSLSTGSNLVQGSTITIIQNDGSDAVNGTFSGLPEGSSFTSGAYIFQISYKGGTGGNDVTLKVIGAPATPVVPGIMQAFATAADADGGPMVTVNYPNGKTVSFWAYDPSFKGGVRIAMGDVNGDNYTDLITAVGAGGGPHIKIWNLNVPTSQVPMEVASFYAFESIFTGGLFVAVGKINSDNFADIIVGAGPGGGPRVSAYAGNASFSLNSNQVMTTFFAYDYQFTGGVTVASADRNGDGLDEIVTGAGPGGGPNVSVFQMVETVPNQFNPVLIQNFFVFDANFRGGIYVAGGRFSGGTLSNGNPVDDIFVGSGPGMNSQVAVAFGTGGFYYLSPFANFQGGVRVGISSSLATTNPAGTNYLMAAAGPGGGPLVKLYQYTPNVPNNITFLDQFFALNRNMTLGVFANTTIL